MSPEQYLAGAFHLALSLTLLLLAIRYMLIPTLMDELAFKIQRIRLSLWSEIVHGNLDRRHPAVRALFASSTASLVHPELFTYSTLILTDLFLPGTLGQAPLDPLPAVAAELPREAQKILEEHDDFLHHEIVSHIRKRSIISIIVLKPILGTWGLLRMVVNRNGNTPIDREWISYKRDLSPIERTVDVFLHASTDSRFSVNRFHASIEQ